jgi:hypothetical protein
MLHAPPPPYSAAVLATDVGNFGLRKRDNDASLRLNNDAFLGGNLDLGQVGQCLRGVENEKDGDKKWKNFLFALSLSL